MIKQILEYRDTYYNILIGQNAQDNWNIIQESKQNDIWFHLDSFPSPHVILTYEKDVPKHILKECAIICKNHSKYCNINKIKVMYTEIKNVSFGEDIGSVNIKKSKTIIV